MQNFHAHPGWCNRCGETPTYATIPLIAYASDALTLLTADTATRLCDDSQQP